MGQLSVTGADVDLFERTMSQSIPVTSAWSDKDEEALEGLTIGFSATYLLNALANFGADTVEMILLDGSMAALLKGDIATTLVMPMMLDDSLKDEAGEEPEDEQEQDEEPEDDLCP